MASESKKEAFRKYLESSGVLDALTKVLVALYEEHDKPPIAIEFVRKALGGPTVAEFEQLTNEKNEIVAKFDALCVEHEEACRKLNELLPPPPPEEMLERAGEGGPEGGSPPGAESTSPPTPAPPAPPAKTSELYRFTGYAFGECVQPAGKLHFDLPSPFAVRSSRKPMPRKPPMRIPIPG
ncbi:hypothetical protein MPTK1_8g07380 [Marchantia polymorpha subsp. ruderalis]|uniref:c-Myc-binding protein n=1 Tax=Marchantia polymorpha TaxID=3197 RepID=A0A2R6XI87_MARPO|nr:hypothetical protein MARPO_0013s0055 [Marchantia polymorpha]BBN19023.1 hypothetical protein Mp_8g07380 [Marchantia polymorpha subsp. ruderalis]|eukprot:PTQ45823.1 hypothetical protein MARPO_0013s0055 [Marchantia polymorpha]